MESAVAIAAQVRSGRTSAEQVIRSALARAEAVQARLNSFITLAGEQALDRAVGIDVRIAAGEDPGPLAGVPVVVKDNICTEGIRSTAGSRSLAAFVPPYSATVVQRLEQAGAVVIAKSNLDEFGMGSSSENSAFGPVRNPWQPDRVPGGSSGGSAAAVAAGVTPLALGTDTGGSVRQPGSFCGVIGFKPTYGRLSRFGVIAFASSLDQVGIMARSAADVALAMDVMGGFDARDATSLRSDRPAFAAALASAREGLAGLRVGVVRELAAEGNSPGVLAALQRMRETLSRLGAEVGETTIPHARFGIPTYYLVATAEASSNLARYDGMIYGTRMGENGLGQAEAMMRTRGETLGPEVRRRVLMGTYALSSGYYDAYYGKALKVRRLVSDDFAQAFGSYDVLMAPTAPTVAFLLGEKTGDPLAMYLGDVATCLVNLVGAAAVSVPAGTAEHALPCGVQFMAPALGDERLLALTAALQRDAGSNFAPLAPGWG